MNIPTIIALIVVAALVALVVRILVKSGGSTCPSCSGSACHGSGCPHCHRAQKVDAIPQCPKCKRAANKGGDANIV